MAASLLAASFLAPAAAAAEGRGGFVTAEPAALWGALRLDGAAERPAALEHRGPEGSLALRAERLVVRVETVQTSSGSGEVRRSAEEHVFTAASGRLAADGGLLVHLGPGTTLRAGPAGPAPMDRAAAARGGPDAMVLLQDSPGPGRACGPRACGPSAGGSPPGAPGALALWPMRDLALEGRLELALLPGAALQVEGAGGAGRFAAERTEETRRSGGLAVPLLGPVAEQEERVVTETSVLVRAEDASAALVVAPAGPGPGGDRSAAPRDRAAAQPAMDRPLPATVLRADELVLALDGSVGLRGASGGLEVAGQRREAREAEVLVGGALTLRLAPAGRGDGGQAPVGTGSPARPGHGQGPGGMAVAMHGDVRAVDLAGPGGAGGAAVYQAAAVAGAAGAVGILALFAPAAKYGFSKVMAVPLYARLRRQELLDNKVRAQLLDLIRGEPGASPAELARRLPCSWNNLVYHLSVLEREGYVTRTREGRRWRFFPSGAQDHSALPALAALRNPRAARLVAEVRERPGIAQHQLGARVALTPSTVHWHMARLAGAGLVRAERDGRVVRYYEGPAARALRDQGDAGRGAGGGAQAAA